MLGVLLKMNVNVKWFVQGTLSESNRKSKVDDETLKFIRQKRPHMQSRGRRNDPGSPQLVELQLKKKLYIKRTSHL